MSDFSRLTLVAYSMLQEAAKLPGLTPIQRAQAEAASKLAGVEFHKISHYATAADASKVRKDLELIWSAADPLIFAIGEQFVENFPDAEISLFTDQVRGALEGNATFACDEAQRIAIEERYEDIVPIYSRSPLVPQVL